MRQEYTLTGPGGKCFKLNKTDLNLLHDICAVVHLEKEFGIIPCNLPAYAFTGYTTRDAKRARALQLKLGSVGGGRRKKREAKK